MPEFIKEHLSALLIVVGMIFGVVGFGCIKAGPPTLEWFIAGWILVGIAALLFLAARKINPSDPMFEANVKKDQE